MSLKDVCDSNIVRQDTAPQYKLDVYTVKHPNLITGSFPDTLLSITENNFNSGSQIIWNPQSHCISELKDQFQPHLQKLAIHGTLGSFAIGNQLFLLVVNKVEEVGSILCHPIYKVEQVEFIPLSRFPNVAKVNPIKVRNEINHYKELLENGEFYFSSTYPLWNHFQNFATQNSQSTGFERYVWNSHMLGAECGHSGLIHLVRGHFKSTLHSDGITMTVASRIDKRNAGTRFTSRGLNQGGIAAISVETEIILSNQLISTSYVQYRGSLPLKWSQESTEMTKKPPVVISKDSSKQLIEKHLIDLNHVLPGKPKILNLVGRTDEENSLSNVLESHLSHISTEVEYTAFPLGWGNKALSELKAHLNVSEQEKENIFVASIDKDGSKIQTIYQCQEGFFRTNCMDCIDRTSIAQFSIVSDLFTSLLQPLLESTVNNATPKLLFDIESDLFSSLSGDWADMSNAIANYYTGTGIVNEPLIRYGSLVPSFGKRDMLICSSRYVQNTTFDLIKKYWMDSFLDLSCRPKSSSIPPVPLRHLRNWSSLYNTTSSALSLNHRQLELASSASLRFVNSELKNYLQLCESLNAYCTEYSLDKNTLLTSLPQAHLLTSSL